MNSLQELNNYISNLTLEYIDERIPEIKFIPDNPVNQSQNVDKSFSIPASVGINIEDVINTDLSNPYYEINLTSVSGATLTWPTLPAGVVATNPSNGVYRLDGIISDTIWNQIKSPTIQTSVNFSGLFSYTSTIGYFAGVNGNITKTWTTSLLINNIVFLRNPTEFIYQANQTARITGTPEIINIDSLYPGAIFTVVVTPSAIAGINTFTSNGSGGTFSVNSTTKVITITGTRTQVNSHLANLNLVSTAIATDFSLSYVASQNINGVTDQAIQLIRSLGLLYLAEATTPTLYYQEDGPEFPLSGVPLITDPLYDGSGDYTYTITPSNVNAIESISSIEVGLPGTYNSTTKTLTLVSTRSIINNALTNLRIRIKTTTDFADDFTISYTVVTPRGDTSTKLQILVVNTNDTEITNMAINRSYIQNNSGLLFTSNIPFISDLDPNPATYTISFSSPIGLFGFNDDIPVSNLSFSGTKSQCNAVFSQVRFWPNKNVSANSNFTYIQQKNGVTQVTQSSALIGSSGSFSPQIVTLTSSTNWAPTYTMLRYASNYDVLLVGGGGGGATGGGGGGRALLVTNVSITNTSYSIVVGGGGAPSPTDIPQSSFNYTGSPGGNTSAFGSTALGGTGGKRQITYGNPSIYNFAGGASGNGNPGGSGTFTRAFESNSNGVVIFNYNLAAGGGGGGNGGAGTNGILNTTNFTATRGVGGSGTNISWVGTVAGGGSGGVLRTKQSQTPGSPTQVLANSTGDQGIGYGGGGGGAWGTFGTTSTVPTAGKAGVVAIRIT